MPCSHVLKVELAITLETSRIATNSRGLAAMTDAPTLTLSSLPPSLSLPSSLSRLFLSLSLPPSPQIVEASDLLVGSDVLLLESQTVSEEKEVGPEIPGDEDDQLSKLGTMLEGNADLDKELASSELNGELQR